MKFKLLTFAALVALSNAQPLETTSKTIEKQLFPLIPSEVILDHHANLNLENDVDCDCNKSSDENSLLDQQIPVTTNPTVSDIPKAASKPEDHNSSREITFEQPIVSKKGIYSTTVLADHTTYKVPVKNSEIFYEAPVPSREVSFGQLTASHQGAYSAAIVADHTNYKPPVKNSETFYQAPVPLRQVPFKTYVSPNVIPNIAQVPVRQIFYRAPTTQKVGSHQSYPVQKTPTYNVNLVATLPTFNRNTFPWPQKTVYRYNTSISGRPVIDFLKNPFVRVGSFLKKSANYIGNKHRFTSAQYFPVVIDN